MNIPAYPKMSFCASQPLASHFLLHISTHPSSLSTHCHSKLQDPLCQRKERSVGADYQSKMSIHVGINHRRRDLLCPVCMSRRLLSPPCHPPQNDLPWRRRPSFVSLPYQVMHVLQHTSSNGIMRQGTTDQLIPTVPTRAA